MGRKMKKLTRAGAGALAGVMVFGLAAPLAPLSVEAADEVKNLAIGSTATVNDKETDYWGADKAVDGIVNRTAAKRDQSRWATNVGGDADAKWLKIDLKEAKTFQSFVLAWERRNITGYKIQISQTGEDNSWEDVYTKTGASHISHINENIHLPEAKTARYVRLYIDGYTANAADDQTNWRSVSLYDFQIYANEIPDTVLPDENYCLEGTAEASNFEEVQSEPGKQGPAKAIDGDLTTRWATESDGKGTTARTLTVKLPAAQWVEYVKIDWEMPASGVPTPKKYTIEAAEKEGGEFTVVHTNSEQVTKAEQIIKLDKPVWAKELKLNVTEYGAATGTWYNVSVAEFGAYAMKPESGVIDENATAKQIADKLAAPTVKADKTGLEWQDVPEGVTVEFLADYEQVVGRDGKIYQPLRETTVKGIYKVTKGEETAEGTREHTVTIPGKYDNAGTNAKPVVIPELAEWYGGTEAGSVKIGEGTKIVYKDAAFKAAAEALAADYKAEYGVDLQVADSGEDAGDIVFTKDDKNGLGEEGYIMEMDDKVNVKAEQAQGAYWSTRSILQIVKLNNGEIPKGITKDYPKFKVRSFSLDVARKPASLESLEDFVDAMAYYKMNDFQVHLNDNLIFYENFESAEVARERAYTGFRLESDIKAGGENKKDLTNEDLFYTKEDFRNFIEESEAQGVSIVPEIDAPGHSGAFTKVRPDLMLPQNQAVNGNAKRAGEQFDLSGDVNSKDSQYGKSLSFVQGVWDEYLTDNMFDDSMTVHIGTDEYYGEENAFRHFSDDMIKYIQGKDRTVRMWGSLTQIDGDGTVPVKSENVQLNVWNTGYSNPKQMYNDGFDLINTLDGSLYMVPNGSGSRGGYGDYLRTEDLYKNWIPNNMGGTVIPAGSDQMLGSTFAIWNDNIDTAAQGISEVDNFERFEDALPILASKGWGEGEDLEFAAVKEKAEKLGDAPGSNPYYEETADKDGKYMSYGFDNKEDSSENNRDIKETKNADIDGALKLKGGESYASTPIEKLAVGNALSFDVTLTEEARAGQILFEADTPGGEDYVHDIRIMDDGRVGFRRELYDYYFDYKLPVGEKVHMEIVTDTLKTVLIVDGKEYQATGIYINRQTDNTLRKQGIKNATLLLPVQRIGSKTNSIVGTIDNVEVKTADPISSKDEYNKAAWTKVSVDTETNIADSKTEGLFTYAFDGKSNTIWHSNWKDGKSDKLKPQGSFDEIGGVINLGQKYTINQFSFTPRQGNASGQVTKADLYVKANEGDEWVKVAENTEFAADASKKTFYFDEQEVQFVKFVAKTSNDGWVAVSEFDVDNEKVKEMTVYAAAQKGGKVTSSAKDGKVMQHENVTVTATPNKEYKFAGWYDILTGEKVSDDAEYTFAVEMNTSLIAHFTKNGETPDPQPKEWTVTIDGTGHKVKDGETLTVEEPSKPGHAFAGFYLVGTDTAVDFTKPITSDMNVESRFTQYKVTAVESENGTITVSEMNDKGEVTVTAKANDGYIFKGWKVDGKETEALGTPYTFVPVKDTTVEAVYEKKDDTKVYHTVIINGQTVTVEDGKTLDRPADPVKEGYKFIGWFVDGKEFDFNTPITGDLKIEARFEKLPTTDKNDKNDKNDKVEGAVQTGDTANAVPWIVCLGAAAGAGVVVLKSRKKRS